MPDTKLEELAKELRFSFPWIPTGQDVVLARAVAVMIVDVELNALDGEHMHKLNEWQYADYKKKRIAELTAEKSRLEKQCS